MAIDRLHPLGPKLSSHHRHPRDERTFVGSTGAGSRAQAVFHFFLEFQDQLRRFRGGEMPWERPAAPSPTPCSVRRRHLAALDDADPNTRIVAARYSRDMRPPCFGELRPVMIEKLRSLLDDRAAHQYAYGGFQCEEVTRQLRSRISPRALARLVGNAGSGQAKRPTPSSTELEVDRTEPEVRPIPRSPFEK